MGYYQEISSLVRGGGDFTLDKLYGLSDEYEYYRGLSSRKLFRILASDPPLHPLARRLDALVRYTARLIGDPNVKEVKEVFIKLLKRSAIDDRDTFHDLVHLVLGQSIRVFLLRDYYTPEEYIYEMIVSILEMGMRRGTIYLQGYLQNTDIIDEFLSEKVVSRKKIYFSELRLFKLYLKKTGGYSRERYLRLKQLLFECKWFSRFHFYKFLKFCRVSDRYPLAVNFKNEAVRALSEIITPDEYYQYKKKFYALIPSIEKEANDFFVRRLLEKNFEEVEITSSFLYDLFSRIEIFPEKTKEIIQKFLLYMSSYLTTFPKKYKRYMGKSE